MNCIIIEDEDSAVKRLEHQLQLTGFDMQVMARIDSVENAVMWLSQNETDLIFLDIQLGDGLGFEIFDHVQVSIPIIFTTSYDEYMAKAFEVNSLSYLLKPVTLNSLVAALGKYKFLAEHRSPVNERTITLNRKFQERFLVRNGTGLQPLTEEEIAYFYVQNKHFVFIVTKDKRQFLYDNTLEVLELRLNPKKFFRINRQFIVGFDCIRQVNSYDNRGRLKLETDPVNKEEMIVSIHRASEFRSWMGG